MSARDTPVMRQHAEAKREYPNALIFFRLGDFYELFGQDAITAAPILDLVLTSRNKGAKDEIPMAGVPHHAAHSYIGRLLDAGYNVALCEQMADPAKCKGIVPRQVVRVITPGLITDRDQLDAASNNWLATIDAEPSEIGLTLLDLSTGELLTASMPNAATLLAELARVSPRECHFFGLESHLDINDFTKTFRATLPKASLRQDIPLNESEIREALHPIVRDSEALIAVEQRSAARAIRLARVCNAGKSLPIYRITRLNLDVNLAIDEVTQSHLELVQSRDGGKLGTLLATLDVTRTPAGARLLRRQLLAPLRDVHQIRRRLDAVEAFVVNSRIRSLLRDALAGVGDLERIASRAVLGEATPRDLGGLRQGLTAAHEIAALLETVTGSDIHDALALTTEPLDTVRDVAHELTNALVDNPPALSKEGAIFRPDYDAQLKEYDQLRRTGTERIAEMESRLREATGISTLKIRFTRVFGWYLEVSRGQAAKVPAGWRRKQTIANGERYTTIELEELADNISHAEERHRDRELELFNKLVNTVGASAQRIQTLSARLSQWDVAAALAEVAHRHDYCRPLVDDSDVIEIRDGRHPVVERLAAQGRFVPNDCTLDLNEERLWLITGPNMAGKSTFLRQVALITIMAQMGSYVPARAAHIGTVDTILSRVGASDNLARGESTFMVEMRETSRILRSATRRSLVILDEIGRGTSTYDGLAIAWSVAEYLDGAIGCRALFATHYHELTRLADMLEHAANHNVTAREVNDDVVFLYRLAAGAASRSYGVAVAKLAALPESVIQRAKDVLAQLESQSSDIANLAPNLSSRSEAIRQLDLFQSPSELPPERKVLNDLRQLEVERLTPIDALTLLDQWKKTLQS